MLVQAVVPKLAIEAFHERVLHRLAWLDEMQLDAAFARPQEQRLAGELRAVVADDAFGQATGLAELLQVGRDPLPRDRGICQLPHALPGVVVNDVEYAEATPGSQLVADEVHQRSFARSGMASGTRGRASFLRRLVRTCRRSSV